VAPNRLILIAAAFLVSVGLGGCLCWLLAQLTPVFGSVKALQDICGLPVLGSISYVGARTRESVAMLCFGGATASLVAAACAAVLLEVIGPGIRALVGLA
jgi:hypothetical protein